MESLALKIEAVGKKALAGIAEAQSLDTLESVRVQVLGKKGELSEVLKGLGTLPPEERPKVGAVSNQWKTKIEGALEERKAALEIFEIEQSIASDRIDVTLPSRRPVSGSLHPITQTTRTIVKILSRVGFDVATGPEAETEFLNFESVNVPKDHPARDMQDTFFLGTEVVLRTHTTPVQMRTMIDQQWPIRILCPGAVYRCDNDATHSPMFHQIEGLWVDRGVRMSDLKGILDYMAKELFGADSKIRLRPSYFPFVEPGAEVDVSCAICGGKNNKCPVCKGTGWLEILGAGMVHPKLYQHAGFKNIPPDLSGFAFGMGVERIAMLLHGIPDLRLMFQGDIRFLEQF